MRAFFVVLCLLVCGTAVAEVPDVVVPLNRSELITDYKSVASVSSDSPAVARAALHSKGRISISGRGRGTTHVTLMSSQGKVIKRLLVKVTEDLPDVRRSIKMLFPNELGVQVDNVNDNIVLSGHISSLDAADRVEKVVKSFVKSKSSGVINLMKISATQQVTLMVRVGEIRKTELVRIGFSGSVTQPQGVDTGAYGLTNMSPSAQGSPFGLFHWFTSLINGSSLLVTLDLLEREGAFKVLANPVLTALSGEDASFMAGGELPVAVFSSAGDMGGLNYKPFGVMLNFNPVVIDSKTIRLKVAQEVSEVDMEGSIASYGYRLPSFSMRKASTTVDLSPGESFMIAGLIKKDMKNVIRDIPGLAKVPILGALFRSVEFMNGETELVIAVTPYLSDPMRGSDVRVPDIESAGVVSALFLGKLYQQSRDLAIEGSVGYILD